jgi:hypothetical protein
MGGSLGSVDLEIAPEQPESIVAAVAEALTSASRGPDPWWQAGLDEALET